ncbi:MAG TPA: ATP-binding cassette domain-containing protein, partial [Chloroflexota bacterium]
MAEALEVRGLTKLFFHDTPRGWAGLLVLDDVTFSVGEQEFVSVLGPSGCGKTTLARILAGIEPADRGQVLLDGKPAGP